MSGFLPPTQHDAFHLSFLSYGIVLQFRSLISSQHLHREHRKVSLPQRTRGSTMGVSSAFLSAAFVPFSIAFSTTFPNTPNLCAITAFPFECQKPEGKEEKRESLPLVLRGCSLSLFHTLGLAGPEQPPAWLASWSSCPSKALLQDGYLVHF